MENIANANKRKIDNFVEMFYKWPVLKAVLNTWISLQDDHDVKDVYIVSFKINGKEERF